MKNYKRSNTLFGFYFVYNFFFLNVLYIYEITR